MQLTNRRVRLMGTVIDVSIYHEEPEPLLDQVEALLHTYNKIGRASCRERVCQYV